MASDPQHPEFGYCAKISEAEQQPILSFIRTLPVALERADLRVVHAAWIGEDIERCRTIQQPLDAAFDLFEQELHRDPKYIELKTLHDHEVHWLGAGALSDKAPKPNATAIGPYDEFVQMGNAIRVITSGVERATQSPFTASGKWRFTDRVAWWREYAGGIPVLFGHYWRWWDPSIHHLLSKGETHLFAEDPVGPYMAAHHLTCCIDFSVGARFKERHRQKTAPFHGRLAAMRWPEREIVYDTEGVGS